MFLRFVLISMISCLTGMLVAQQDPFLHRLYDSLHSSPAQRKFKRMAPMPAGVVYIQQPEDGQKEMRGHFRMMKKLGFNALKQIMVAPGWTEYDVARIALEEGIIPWWYGEGGYEEITPQLLQQLELPATLSMKEALEHPIMVQYQKKVLADRIEAQSAFAKAQANGQFLRAGSVAYDPEIGGRGVELTDKGVDLFIHWLKERYHTVEALNHAWNTHHTGLALGERRKFSSWEDVRASWKNIPIREYNHVKDIYRFKVSHNLNRIRENASIFQKFDRNVPYRGGGEMSLFHPFAWYSVDMEGVANTLTEFGSFYPSMHFSWHYDLTKGELPRSMYMQAALMNDLFKGGWTGGWESTGGPQQLDGEKEADHPNAYFVDEGEVMQLFLSQLAAGFRGFGVWCWNPRSAGKEGGEYSLLDRNGQITPRAIRLGEMGKAMQKYRFELWSAHKEPTVGILYDWENEATWAAMSIPGRDNFRMQPVMARIGVTRALMDANVPFEYVTPTDLLKGLSGRYKVIYLPAQLSIRADLLPALHDYVRAGGRLVMDLPGAWYDQNTVLMPTGKGSPFASLFGASIDDFQYAGTNRIVRLGTDTLKGFVMNATPLGASVRARYDNGKPAVFEHAFGKGTAVLLGFQASLNSFGTANAFGKTAEVRRSEHMLLKYALSTIPRSFTCNGALAYRLAGEKADHYILINEGPTNTVRLETPGYSYRLVIDAVTGEKVNPASINLKGYDGRWLRFEK
jgi:beta-galactosidase